MIELVFNALIDITFCIVFNEVFVREGGKKLIESINRKEVKEY